MNKKRSDITHHATRNLAATVAVTLLLAASALAEDTETVLHTFSGGSDGAIGGHNWSLIPRAIFTAQPFQAETSQLVAEATRVFSDAVWSLS